MREVQQFTFCGHKLDVTRFPSLPTGYRFKRCLQDWRDCMSIVLKRAAAEHHQRHIDQELRILSECKGHPHIVELLEDNLVDDWLIIEYMGGGSFETVCEVPQNLMLRIALDTSAALSFLHDKNTIHRDVKPQNIFFVRDSRNKIISVKLADMGVATNSTTTRFAGTRPYAAFETLLNTVTPASDMWSWASTMAHLATGVKPFQGDDKFTPYSTELRDVELPAVYYELLMQCFDQTPMRRLTAEQARKCCCDCLCDTSSTKLLSKLAPTPFEEANYIDKAAALANVEIESILHMWLHLWQLLRMQ